MKRVGGLIQADFLLQVFLRAATLLSKFVLTFFLAKTLDVAHFVEYGLFSTWVIYALYFVGFDYYTFATRFIIRYKKKAGTVLASQLCFYGLLYALCAVLMWGLWLQGAVSGKLALFFVAIMIAEHLSQEGFRLFVATDHLSAANIAQFLRTGLWCILGILICLFFHTISLDLVLSLWLASASLSVLFLAYYGHRHFGNVFKGGVSPFLIRAGLVKATTMFIATMLLRGLFTVDRVLMEKWTDKNAVAAYLFFWTVANGYMAFIDVGIVSRIYPKMLASKQPHERLSLAREMRSKIGLAYLLLVLLLWLSQGWIIPLLPGVAYVQFFYLLPIVLLAGFLYAIGLGDHYLLYAQKKDNVLLQSTCYAAGFFALTLGLFAIQGWNAEVWAIPVILCLTCAALTLVRRSLMISHSCKKIS